MAAIWERIEAWYQVQGASHLLHQGATVTDMAATERQIGVTFPAEMRESLLRHNGSTDGGWSYGTLLDLEGIQREEQVWRSLLDDGTFHDHADHDASEGRDEIQQGWWVRGWIPLDADGGGNGAVVDAVPGPRGRVGQIIDMDHEIGPSGPAFQSLSGYLNHVLEALESGEYSYYKNKDFDFEGICTADEIADFEEE